MAYGSLSREEKHRFLRALEEDREFRYAVMGLIGYREVLDRITKLEERFARLEERQQKLEERQQRLEERQQKLEERQQKLEEEIANLRRVIEHTRRDVGALTEAMYSRMVWEDLREEIKARGEKVVSRKRNVKVDGYDIDLMIESETSIYVVEIKIQPNHHDVNELLEKTKAIEVHMIKKAIPVIAGTWIGGEVRKYCSEKGVNIIEY